MADLEVAAFDAIVVAGGQAPMFSFEGATDLHAKFIAFFEAGKVAAALCHGSAILAYAKDSQGRYIAKGRTVTGFANVEEDFADNAVWSYGLLPRDKHVMPWRIEDKLKALGANYVQGGAVAQLRGARRQSGYRPAELLRRRDGAPGDRGAGPLKRGAQR